MKIEKAKSGRVVSRHNKMCRIRLMKKTGHETDCESIEKRQALPGLSWTEWMERVRKIMLGPPALNR